MIHARADYDRIQDPAVNDPSLLSPGSTPIGENEPVFLIRANDRCAYGAVMAWARELESMGGDPRIVAHVRQWVGRMEQWRREHGGGKVPDAPVGLLR